MIDWLRDLMRRARDAFERLTPDQQTHHRHEQRISFVTGNVGLSQPDRDPVEVRAGRAVGPCPCGPCRAARAAHGMCSLCGLSPGVYEDWCSECVAAHDL